MKELTDHPLVERFVAGVYASVPQMLRDVAASIDATGDLPPFKVETPLDPYTMQVQRRLQPVMERFTRLNDSYRFVAKAPRRDVLQRWEMAPDQWIEHHYSTHVVAIASLGDLALLLINAVLDLGIPSRLCTSDLIRNLKQVRNSPVGGILQQLEGAIKHAREMRNLLVHRGETPGIEDATGADGYNLLRFALIMESLGHEQDKRLLARGFRVYSKHVAESMNADIESCREIFFQLLDVLTPYVDERLANER